MDMLYRRLWRSSFVFLLIFAILISFFCLAYAQNLITDRLLASKRQEMASLMTRVKTIYDEAEYKLALFSYEKRLAQFIYQVETSQNLYDKSDRVQAFNQFLVAMLANQVEFRAMYVITDTFIIGQSVRNFSCYKELSRPIYIAAGAQKESLCLALQSELLNDQFGKALLPDQIILADCGGGRYLAGILNYGSDLAADDSAIVLMSPDNRVLYSGASSPEITALAGDTLQNGYRFETRGGRAYLVLREQLIGGTIQCVLVTDMQYTHSQFARLGQLIALMDMLLLIAFALIHKMAAKRIIRPLKGFEQIVTNTDSFASSEALEAFIRHNRKKWRLKLYVFAFYCLNFIPLFIIVLVTGVAVSDIIAQETIKSYNQIVCQSADNIESQMRKYTLYANYLALDAQTQRYLLAQSGQYKTDEWYAGGYASEESFFRNIPLVSAPLNQQGIGLHIFNDVDQLVFSNMPNPVIRGLNTARYGHLSEFFAYNYWSADDSAEGFTFLKKVRYLPTNGLKLRHFQFLGNIELVISGLLPGQPIISDAGFRSFDCIVGADGTIYEMLLSQWYDKQYLHDILTRRSATHAYSDVVPLPQGNALLSVQPIQGTGYALASFIPLSNLDPDSVWLLYAGVGVTGALVLIVLIASRLFTNRILHPLEKLGIIMGSVDFDNYLTLKDNLPSNEFYQLFKSFKDMLDRLNQLSETVREQEIQQAHLERRKKEAELVALQTQINPHFLYNIFTSINMLLRMERVEEAKKMLAAAGQLFCLGIYRGARVVPAAEELRHVEVYLQIQQIRYYGKLEYVCDVDELFFTLRMPKLLLQPLVENAIEHGLKNREKVLIAIHFRLLDEKRFQISVEDNGGGIEPNELEKLKQTLQESIPSVHYGLANVNERIQLYFGSAYGLSIDSKMGVGTTVLITLPLDKLGDEGDEKSAATHFFEGGEKNVSHDDCRG